MSPFKLALSSAVIGFAGLASPAFAGQALDPGVIPGLGPDPGGAYTQQAPSAGRYGGGFVEFLMTGHAEVPPRTPRYMASAASAAAAQPGYGFEPQAGQAPIPGYESPRKAVDPMFLRQEVEYDGAQAPGTIVIDTASKFLYLVEDGGHAMRYGIGVGRPGFLWAGEKTISRKAEWPDWTPPAEMLQRRPDLPLHMAGGIANPLGARAMYLGSSLYRIHGTNEPDTIGTNVSSGCIRLTNDDVSDLYSRVRVGTHVIVM